ncbi:MAG: putative rane protein [Herbinix sp.]|jgi:NitT/TauT family transport system permease protein|nr:putative rane protein [Herbinix sp.]
MRQPNNRELIKKYGVKIMAVCFWLLLWQLLSVYVKEAIFMASPVEVLFTLLPMLREPDFWQTICFSFIRIVAGFVLAIVTGTILAVLAYRSFIFKELIQPIIIIMKSIPVASFIILALIWIKAVNLSTLVSFLMVLPIIFTTVGEGLKSTDQKLLQMATVFHVGRIKRLRAIYIPAVLPHYISAITIGLGFCWKAGIAAEVIGIPTGSIGERLYEAKIFFMTKELFAWTVVIVLISILFEKLVMRLIKAFWQ